MGLAMNVYFYPHSVIIRAPVTASTRLNMTHLLKKLNTLQKLNTRQMAIEPKNVKKKIN